MPCYLLSVLHVFVVVASYRGYYSRHYYANYYRRRLYLQTVTQTGLSVIEQMCHYQQQEQDRQTKQLLAEQQQSFTIQSEQQHHRCCRFRL